MENVTPSSTHQTQAKNSGKIIKSIFFLIALVVIGGLSIVFWYSSIDVSATGGRPDNLFGKIGTYFYQHKCQKQNGVFAEEGWNSLICYKKSSMAGKECLQNSDCQDGVCEPSAVPYMPVGRVNAPWQWRGIPKVNKDGFITGTCSEAVIPFDPEHGGTCWSNYILKPATLADPSGIREAAFCN